MKQETLLKSLIAAGLGSRRYLTKTILEGRIKVNGETANNFSLPVDFRRDIILLDNKPVKATPKLNFVLMLNKPAGILSTTKDDLGRKTVMSMLPQQYRNSMLYPVGRLDKDTTGLLLLTNDGELTYQLTHPKFEHEKEYLILAASKLSSIEKLQLEKGIQLEDGITYPAILKDYSTDTTWEYSLTIHEGKHRQIRRMFAKLGVTIVALRRIRIGRLTLGNLKEGEIRALSDMEINMLLQNPE